MKKLWIKLAALEAAFLLALAPLVASAQSYPSPTFNSVVLQNPLSPANGGTGATSSTGTGSVALSNSPALTTPSIANPTITGSLTATGLITLADHATQAANTVIANVTGSTASPTAFAMPGCSSSTSALQYTSGTGFACNSSVNAATLNGATFAAPSAIGTTTRAAGNFTALAANGGLTVSGGAVIAGGGTIDGAAIGSTTPSTGSFTTLAASNTVSGTGFSNYLASPPAIGATTAAAGSFTNLSSSGTVSGTGFSNYLASPPAIGGTAPNTVNATSLSQVINPGSGSPAANCAPSPAGNYCFNQYAIGASATHDAIAAPTTGAFVNGVQVAHYYGGSTMTGGRQSLYVQSSFTNPSSTSNTNHNYVAGTFFTQVDAGDNGTGLTNTTAQGAFFGMNPYVQAYSGATNLLEVAGAEFNIGMATGSSAWYKAGLTVVDGPTDQVSGSVYDAGIGISAQSGGNIGFVNGILFGPMNGAFPVQTTGCLICSTGSSTVATGIDFSSLTMTNFLKGPGGFAVNGSGTVAANGINSTGTLLESGSNASGILNDTSSANGAQWLYQKNGTTLYTAGSDSGSSSFYITRYVSGSAVDHPIAIANSTGVVSIPDGIAGTTTGSTASVGNIGNVQTASSSAISLSNSTPANGTSLSVAAGDYMVQCIAQFNPASGTSYNNLQVGVNTTSATMPAFPNLSIQQWSPNITGALVQTLTSPFVHVSLSSAGTLYCPVYATFGSSTMTASTTINVLRIH